MSTRTLLVAATIAVTTACAADGDTSGDPTDTGSPVAVAVAELAPDHHVTFFESDGALLLTEHGPKSARPALGDVSRLSPAQIYSRLLPHQPVPESLLRLSQQPSFRPATAASNKAVGALSQAVTKDEFFDRSGCACPLDRVVRQVCAPDRTGNISDAQTSEFAWFHIGHESGDGLDVFTKIDGKVKLKDRVEPGEFIRYTSSGGQNVLGTYLDKSLAIEVKGGNLDWFHFGACWSNLNTILD